MFGHSFVAWHHVRCVRALGPTLVPAGAGAEVRGMSALPPEDRTRVREAFGLGFGLGVESGPGGAEGGGGVSAPAAVVAPVRTLPTEAQLREHILARLPAWRSPPVTLRQALDRVGEHFGIDARASGLKPVIKRVLAEGQV
jgi:hypothetical protein